MNEKHLNSELRQEELRELIGKIPTGLIKWGAIFVFLVVTLILLGMHWIKYPDRINGIVTITTKNHPVSIFSRQDGMFLQLFVKEKDTVKEGEILGIIESSANYYDMLTLDNIITRFNLDDHWMDSEEYLNALPDSLELGTWQSYYSNFHKNFKEYFSFMKHSISKVRIASMQTELSDYKTLMEKQQYLEHLSKEELALTEINQNRILLLKDSGALTETESEKSKFGMLNAQANLEVVRTNFLKTQIEVDRIRYLIITEGKEFELNYSDIRNRLIHSLEIMSGAIKDWKLNYALISPIKGTISLTDIWSKNQSVIKGAKVFTIVPNSLATFLGKMQIPITGAGKVSINQAVYIQVDQYPYMDFGMLKGEVENISLVPENGYYIVDIRFLSGLKTTYSKDLKLTEALSGKAKIITAEMSLLFRIIKPLKSLLKHDLN
jgi:HlyD family secretion protein